MNRTPFILVAFTTLIVTTAAPGLGQETAAVSLETRRDDVPRGKRVFQETWLLPTDGNAADGPEATVFGGRVDVFQDDRRERIEIRRVVDGTLTDAVVIVSDRDAYYLVTSVGATPFLESAHAADAWVNMVLSAPAGEAAPYRTLPADAGGLAAVVLRSEVQANFDSDAAFAIKKSAVGRSLLKSGLTNFSAGDSEVAASAGARGVGRVRTADGDIDVTPDPAAVQWMDSIEVDVVMFETFRREARLAPYNTLPE